MTAEEGERRAGGFLSHVVIRKLRGTDFNLEFSPRRINLIVGCEGSYKTSLLEALAVSLMTADLSENPAKYTELIRFLRTMRMNPDWPLNLWALNMDVEIDGITVRPFEVKQDNESSNSVWLGFAAYYNNEEVTTLKINVTVSDDGRTE
ncbi:hypothetical protein, partial [Acidilobus sp.]|uniref:hypothetical protein n=1 Tax=Acidilobus sp. TaxID=1872109 RepID=UPI003D074383